MLTSHDTSPNGESSDTEINIGNSIRAMRNKRGWSLTDAAKTFGIGRSTLAKVEAASMSPTIGLLQKIAQGLEVDITALISNTNLAPAAGRLTVTYSGQGEYHSTKEHSHELLGSGLANKRMVPFRSRIKARKISKVPPPWYRHDAEEFIFVLEGEVVLHTEHYAPTELTSGDSVYLDGRMGHYFLAKGEHDAVVLFVLAQS